MKASFLLAAVVPATLGHALSPRATACNHMGNNCQRGVSGVNGRQPLEERLADCSSYLSVTVTPAATTTTITATTTTTTTSTSHTGILTDRDVTVSPSDKPAYATFCDNGAAYYSACLCAGVTPATTTAPTPTVTYTATTTTVTDCVVEYAFRKRGWDGLADFIDYAFH